RTEKEMPANPIEIHESKLEGIEYMFLTAPVKVNKDKNGNIETLTCIKMGLGEPDASGRRRPVPIEGSEVDVKLDIVLAAIGQKTEINFLDDINKVLGGELKPNKWGDLEADKNTLQTGIKNVFACGDGVTGAATLIEAVGQARIASLSCHQYLMGQPIVPLKNEFISRRESFKEQIADDYSGKFNKQLREEMPTLNPKDRNNFYEVELGYENENVAVKEAHRCLECGCVEYFTCDLKKLSDEYGVEQQRFSGDFKEYRIDFRHPYIEIDNNKCILCSRCVRICNELNGANALGLVNRGFDTYVAPSMGQALFETDCETCGLCVSTCPTAAISENVSFKPGPVKMQTLDVICNYCSVGCAMSLHHRNGFVMKVAGRKGIANPDGSLCRKGRFGYLYLNDKKRITQPMLKTNGKHEVISFEKAAEIIAGKIKAVKPDENALFAGARMTNEEMYLVQKLARAAVKTNNVGSFHYAGQKDKFKNCNSYGNMPVEQLEGVKKIWLIGSEVNSQNAVIGFMMNNLRFRSKATLELITTNPQNRMQKKVDSVMIIKSYYHFVKSVNHYLLSNKMENAMFIKDQCENFDEYSKKILAEKFDDLVKASGCTVDQISKFASKYNNEMNALIVFSEAEVSANAAIALYNLAMITGKLGKTSTGIIGLKEKNNSQGLFDMGITTDTGIGYQDMSDASFRNQLEGTWKTTGVPQNATSDLLALLETGSIKNLFIFGEDPVGCAIDQNQMKTKIGKSAFVVVQDYFMTDTAMQADLILPASLPFEIGGHFTNTVGVIQKTNAVLHSVPAWNSCMQLTEIMKALGVNSTSDPDELILEIASLLGKFNPDESDEKYRFIPLDGDNFTSLFNFGCDSLGKRFADEFMGKMKTAKETLALEMQA
ncbi:MAG: molybdopterin-dependent oxidoreductase, partial [Bacteroidota bacterium]